MFFTYRFFMQNNKDKSRINNYIVTEILAKEKEQEIQKFTEYVFGILNRYATITNQLDPFYKKMSKILLAMDDLYLRTYTNFWRITSGVKAGKLFQKDVQQEKNELATTLIEFEAQYRENKEQLNALIRVLKDVRKDNVQEFIEKNDEVAYLFQTIYADIEWFYAKYDQLLRIAKRK